MGREEQHRDEKGHAMAGHCLKSILCGSAAAGNMPATINRRHFITSGMAAAAMPYLACDASAQGTWPSRSIRMVCSYPAGGQTDLLARTFGDYISKQVGQTVLVENKAGASGSIGAMEVAR